MTNAVSTRTLHRRMWRLAGPIILANSSVPLLGAVDTAVMGHLPDPSFLGAIAIGALVFSFLYWGLGFLRMGTTGLTAQAFGALEQGETAANLGAVFTRAGALGLALALAVLALQEPLRLLVLPLFGAAPDVQNLAGDYVRIRIWSAPASLINFVVFGWLLGVQRATTALVIQVVLNSLNAGLDLLFVIGFGWGIEGVAAGTVIAEYSAAILGVALVLRHLRRDFAVTIRPLLAPVVLFHTEALRRLLSVNVDIFLRTAFLLAAFGIFTASGAAIGTVTLAANAVLMNFLMFMSYGLDGFAFAAEALVGAEKGARNEQGFRRAVRVTTLWAGLTALVYALVYGVLGTPIIRLLTDLPEIRAVADVYLIWAVLMPLIAVWSFQLDGIFVGLTRTRDMRNAMAAAFVVFLAAVAILRPLYGNHGLWAAFTLFMVARGLAMAWCYRRVGDDFTTAPATS